MLTCKAYSSNNSGKKEVIELDWKFMRTNKGMTQIDPLQLDNDSGLEQIESIVPELKAIVVLC